MKVVMPEGLFRALACAVLMQLGPAMYRRKHLPLRGVAREADVVSPATREDLDIEGVQRRAPRPGIHLHLDPSDVELWQPDPLTPTDFCELSQDSTPTIQERDHDECSVTCQSEKPLATRHTPVRLDHVQ